MSPFMRGLQKGWMVVYGGLDPYFGEMIGFMAAILFGILCFVFFVVICGAIFEWVTEALIPRLKRAWRTR